MKKTHTAIAILTGLAALAAAAQFSVSLAGPAAEPPNGNIIPTFNGLNIVGNPVNGRTLNISADWAQISDTSAMPVIFSDTQGISLANGGGITAYGQDVKFIDFFGTNSRIDAQIPIVNMNEAAPNNNPVLVADNGGFAVASTGTSIAALVADPTKALLTISGISGSISNNSTSPVMINDLEGLAVANGSGVTTLLVNGGNGSIKRPDASYPVNIADNDGFLVGDNSGNVGTAHFKVAGASDAVPWSISNPYSIGANPLTINDDTYVTGNVGIGATPSTTAQLYIKNNSATTSTLIDLDQNNATKRWTGMLFRRLGTEKWFMGVSDTDDKLLFRRNASVNDMVIDTSGNVGIGTVSPAWKLEVNGGGSFTPGGSGGRINLGSPASQTGITFVNTNRADLRFDDSTVKLVAGTGTGYPAEGNGIAVNTAGNVGIGTTAPSSRLTLAGETAQFPNALFIAPTGHATSERASLQLDNWVIGQDGNGNGVKDFFIYDADSATHRLLITAGGNVGIGTGSPGAKLEVAGGEVKFPGGSSGLGWNTHFNYSGDGKNYIRGTTIIADDAGNVGIGDSTPSYKLDVTGSAHTTGSVVSGDNVTAYNGYVRASSIGYFYERAGGWQDADLPGCSHYDAGMDVCYAESGSCDGGDYVLDYGVNGINITVGFPPRYVFTMRYSDHVAMFWDPNNGPNNVQVYVLCWSPDGP